MRETLFFEAGELDFDQWCDLVDIEVRRITALGREDFADWGYADAYGDCVEPVDAARDMLASTAIGSEFLGAAGINPSGSFW